MTVTPVPDDPAVPQLHDAVGEFHQLGVVGGDQRGDVLAVHDGAEHLHRGPPGVRVERRRAGFYDALRAHGVPYAEEPVSGGPPPGRTTVPVTPVDRRTLCRPGGIGCHAVADQEARTACPVT